MCVQRLDDSHSAIRITYRISLRSSSSQEPRYPLLKVVNIVNLLRFQSIGVRILTTLHQHAAVCRGFVKTVLTSVTIVVTGVGLFWF